MLGFRMWHAALQAACSSDAHCCLACMANPAANLGGRTLPLCTRYGKECEYQQPFMPDGTRLCINCTKPVPGKAAAQPADATLDGMTPLFCRWGVRRRQAGLAGSQHATRCISSCALLVQMMPCLCRTLASKQTKTLASCPAAASARAGLRSNPTARPTAVPCSAWSAACASSAGWTATRWSSACRCRGGSACRLGLVVHPAGLAEADPGQGGRKVKALRQQRPASRNPAPVFAFPAGRGEGQP